MPPIFATDSCHCQQLIRAEHQYIVQPMVANTKDDFARRLNEACDNAPDPIPDGRGRRAELRRRVMLAGLQKVSGEAVRKWLSGDTFPSMDNIRYIAIALHVDADWLLTGRQPQQYKAVANSNVLVAEQPTNVVYGQFNEAISQVIDIMEALNDEEQRDIVGFIRIFARASRATDNPVKRAGQ